MARRLRRLFSLSDCAADQQFRPSNDSKYPTSESVFLTISRLRDVVSDLEACMVFARDTAERLLVLGSEGVSLLRYRMQRMLSLGHDIDSLDSEPPIEQGAYCDDEEVMGEEAYRSPFPGGLTARRPLLYLADDEEDDPSDDDPPPLVA